MNLDAIPSRLLISVNKEKLYNRGDILICPLCSKEHYQLMRDIYKKDKMFPQQFKRVSSEIKEPAEYVDHRCQFCMGGEVVPLQQKLHGRSFA